MFAWQIEEQLRCRGCGNPTDETMAKEADGLYSAQLWICHACAAGEAAIDNARSEGNRMFGVRARVSADPPQPEALEEAL